MDKEESFAELYEQSLTEDKKLEPGQLIETTIVSISGETIFLDLTGKSEGVMDASELTDKEGNLTVAEGDTIKAYFLNAKGGELNFTTRISGDKAGSDVLENAYKNGIPVEGVVDKEQKGGFSIKIGGTRAFCPYSQMGQKRVEDASIYVGRHLTFKILEYSERGRNVLVSNRAILEAEREKQVVALKETLKEGLLVKGVVKEIRDFGAFVDLNGMQALLPISEIKRSRVEDIHSELKVGQEVEALVLKIDWKTERISISTKALQADPWTEAVKNYPVDTKHTGTVSRLADFGAFVTLEPGLDGLVHVSDMNLDSRDMNPRDILKKGDSISVRINSVDPKQQRISLKLLSSVEEDGDYQKYLEPEVDTYNPFAELLKKKK